MRHLKTAVLLWGISLFAPSPAAWYTNETDFLNAVGARYIETLDMHTPGNPLKGDVSWDAPGANGFGWTLYQELTSMEGAIRQDVANDELAVFMTGQPTYAFGGYFYAVDGSGEVLPLNHINFIGGPGGMYNYHYHNGNPNMFVGWVGDEVLDRFAVHIISGDPSNPEAFASVTGIIVGAPVPEPSTLAALVLVLGFAWRRRHLA
jgi:hypothetical protein